jgi:hypothetical protein
MQIWFPKTDSKHLKTKHGIIYSFWNPLFLLFPYQSPSRQYRNTWNLWNTLGRLSFSTLNWNLAMTSLTWLKLQNQTQTHSWLGCLGFLTTEPTSALDVHLWIRSRLLSDCAEGICLSPSIVREAMCFWGDTLYSEFHLLLINTFLYFVQRFYDMCFQQGIWILSPTFLPSCYTDYYHGCLWWFQNTLKLESSLSILMGLIPGPPGATKIQGCLSPLYKMTWHLHITYA